MVPLKVYSAGGFTGTSAFIYVCSVRSTIAGPWQTARMGMLPSFVAFAIGR